jgi:hypothetical protein
MRDEELFESSANELKKVTVRHICLGCGDIFYSQDDAMCHLFSDHPNLDHGSVEDKLDCFERRITVLKK